MLAESSLKLRTTQKYAKLLFPRNFPFFIYWIDGLCCIIIVSLLKNFADRTHSRFKLSNGLTICSKSQLLPPHQNL